MKSKICIMITVLAMAVVSCHENDIEYDTQSIDYRIWDFAAPIAKIHVPFYYSLKKELDNTYLEYIDGDSVICVKYTHSEKIKWDDKIVIDDYATSTGIIGWTYDLGGAVLNSTKPLTVHLTVADNDDSYVNEAELTSGIIDLILKGTGASGLTGTITVSIPGLTKNEVPFVGIINLPASEASFSLEGYSLTTDENHELNAEFTINATGSGSLDLSIDLELSEMDVSYLSGYFGELEYNPEDRDLKFDFFEKMDFNGVFGFQNMKMNVDVTNWTGIPIYISSEAFFIYEKGFSDQLLFEDDIAFDVPMAPKPVANQVAQIEKSFTTTLPQVEFESGNYPIGLKFINLNGKANPYGRGGTENFVVKDEQADLADIDFTLTVPLIIRIEAYSRRDTVAFDYNDIIGYDEEFSNSIEYIDVTLAIVNGLPFDIIMEAIAIDGDDKFVETIRTEMPIVAEEGTQYIPIRLLQSELKQFKARNVKNIVLHTTSKTDGYVTVKKDAFIDIAVSIQFKSSSSIIFE